MSANANSSNANANGEQSGLMESLESLPIDWRILLVLLIVVLVGFFAYKKGMIPGMGSNDGEALKSQP